MEMYKRMCIDIKQEQNNYVNEQKKKVLESDVLNILDEKIEKMVQEYCKIEQARLSQYPQFYKYFNLLHMSIPDSSAESSVLSFKGSLLQTGKIATCKVSVMETPRRLDLFKKYIVTPPNETINEEEEEIDNYYKKKLPPTVSVDENITQLTQTNEVDIVISSECLVSLVELVNDVSLDICVPIRVIEKDGKNILMFDRPLPREEMTARERNKLIYDIAFKSLCLDWPNRHDIVSITKETENTESNQEENLQYNMWKFGEMNILIRHQIDGELVETGTKKPGSKDRRVYLTSKLDYQISEGREEITPANERAVNWIRSYIAGHATVLEGRIDVVNNKLVRVDRKEMVDIMGGQWRPMLESELLRHIFSKLHKNLLEPGHYLLQHKKDDHNFLIFQGTDTLSDLDLLSKKKLPILSKSDKSFIPAWSAIENQIPWTFQPNK
ncbi:hypothetical protein BD770DRAFT_38425 [Pilaira anomala]|nr:hypothetical protein BD770DRAFT_38425 [Pilaira anomala]